MWPPGLDGAVRDTEQQGIRADALHLADKGCPTDVRDRLVQQGERRLVHPLDVVDEQQRRMPLGF